MMTRLVASEDEEEADASSEIKTHIINIIF